VEQETCIYQQGKKKKQSKKEDLANIKCFNSDKMGHYTRPWTKAKKVTNDAH